MNIRIFKIHIIGFLLLFPVLRSNSQLVVNEIFLTNCSADLIKPDYNYLNWIEIQNNSNSAISLSGYYLSDDLGNLKKWPMTIITLSAKAFIVFYADGANTDLHSNLKPDANGGEIIISNNDIIVDRFVYPKQCFNASYGRRTDGDDVLCYFSTPTREKTNNSSPLYIQAQTPVLLKGGGYYSGSFKLELQNPTINGKIYYTTDGSEPNETSSLYSSPVTISATTVFRARLFEQGSVPSKIVTQTYFVNQRLPLVPVVSIVTPKNYLFDDTMGIYVRGVNGIDDNGSNGPANWNQDWERCANMEVYDIKKEQVVNQLIGAKVFGGWSRSHDQKSLVLYAKNKYSKKRFHYKFFDEREFTDFNSILLRNGGNDWNYTMFRDAMIQKLTDSNMDVDHQMFKPAVIFINGEYYGLQPFYERSGEDLIEAKYGISEDKIDMLDWNCIASNGSAEGYFELLDYLDIHSLVDESKYNHVINQIDLDEYIDYLIIEIYSGNRDWPGNNNKIWRKNNPVGKWRWTIYDTDFGFGLYDGVSNNTLQMALTVNSDFPNPEWATRLFRKLVENDKFKQTFINRFYAHINSTFDSTLVIKTIDSIANIISDEIPYHFTKWGIDPGQWESKVEIMRNYARKRPDIMRQYLRSQFSLESEINVKYHNNGVNGFIAFDNIRGLDTTYNGLFPSGTITKVKFIPVPGYKFSKATKIDNYSSKVIYEACFTDTLNSNTEYYAYYEPANAINNIIINEVATNNDYFEDEAGEKDDWFEVYNNGEDTVDLSQLFFTDSLENPLMSRLSERYPESTSIAPGEYKVLWADKQLTQGPLHVNFKLDKDGEYLGIYQLSGKNLLKLDDVISNKTTSRFVFARFPDVYGDFQQLFRGTPGTENIDLPVDVKEIAGIDELGKIYYNQTNKQLYIEFTNENNNVSGQIMISDMNGRVVLLRNINQSNSVISMSTQIQGLYLIRVVINNRITLSKILVQ